MKKKIPLADMIVALRKELLQAQQKGADEDLRFRVEDVEMEVQVTVSTDAQTQAGFDFWVIDAKTKAKVSAQSLHKIKLKLTPFQGDPAQPDENKPVTVSDSTRLPD